MKRFLLAVLTVSLCSCGVDEAINSYGGDSPIYPDYRDVTVPVNIAPLNFSYVNVHTDDITTTFSAGEEQLVIEGADVALNRKDWEVLKDAALEKGYICVSSTALEDPWKIYVSRDSIDYGVTYRLIPPGYGLYGKMGIYEYDFESGSQSPVLENDAIESNCVNCHSFKDNDPARMCLHIRGNHSGTFFLDGDDVKVFNTVTEQSGGNCVYPYWHCSGNYVAFSVNKTKQAFYVNPDKLIEVYDLWSDMWVYDLKLNKLFSNESLHTDAFLETFPAFSADGRSLYFCRSRSLDSLETKENLHYDLCRVSFNPENGELGTDVETLIDAASAGKSVLFPRPSYDGRYLVYTLCDFGTFPIWHKESDLWIMDLRDGSCRPLDGANSPDTESYHSWSSNSRWLVFSSRRDDTRFTRLYVCHIGPDGQASKAFMIPQKDPVKYYNNLFYSYNVPNFVTGKVKLPGHKARRSILSRKRDLYNN